MGTKGGWTGSYPGRSVKESGVRRGKKGEKGGRGKGEDRRYHFTLPHPPADLAQPRITRTKNKVAPHQIRSEEKTQYSKELLSGFLLSNS